MSSRIVAGLLFILLSASSYADWFSTQNPDEPLPPEQVFIFSANLSDNSQQIIANWKITEGHYLYRDTIEFEIIKGTQVVPLPATFPASITLKDPDFGDMEVYSGSLTIPLPVNGLAGNIDLKVKYQGCAESGYCYPPIEHVVPLTLSSDNSASAPTPAVSVSEQDKLAKLLSTQNYWLSFVTFFLLGIGLAFTPCVLPMIPILSSIIVGEGDDITTGKAFRLSLTYVLAMAITYAGLGVLAGLAGHNLQAAMQNIWVIIGFSLVFVFLALSMFGLYDLSLPQKLHDKVSKLTHGHTGGAYDGAAIMGFLSSLIVSPCLTPALAGALLYLSDTGNVYLGGGALFSLAMGMGVPIILVGTFEGSLLPKTGRWMNAVKAVFGVLLLGLAIWILERVLPGQATLFLWAALFIVSSVFLGAFVAVPTSGWKRFFKGVGIVFFLCGILMLIGAGLGNTKPYAPLENFNQLFQASNLPKSLSKDSRFVVDTTVVNETQLAEVLAKASNAKQPVILDFYADWCVSCKKIEAKLSSDTMVMTKLREVMVIKVDVTANTTDNKAIMQSYQVFAPPTFVFIDAQGNETTALRLVGEFEAAAFKQNLLSLLKQ